MSGASGAGPPAADGVVRSSTLAFLGSGQSAQTQNTCEKSPEVAQELQSASGTSEASIVPPDRLVPAGVQALCQACLRVYPDQPNPLQVTTRLKYWLGGHDPLDYISMYWNPGDPSVHSPPHWHYISFGLTDLHGDGRVHERDVTSGAGTSPSGAGFELTFRLASPPSAAVVPAPPPLWPAALLQALARYVFTTGNRLMSGDHVSWHCALDATAGPAGSGGAPGGAAGGRGARIKHLLVADDPQLQPAATPHGTVRFLQMVGCTSRELKAAQQGSGFEVLNLLAESTKSGGRYLVTDCSRRRSVVGAAGLGGGKGGPRQLAGVSARSCWSVWVLPTEEQQSSPKPLSPAVEEQIKETLQRGLTCMSTERRTRENGDLEGHMSTDSFQMSSIERALPDIPELMQGSWRGYSEEDTTYLPAVHIVLNAEGASLLPLAINGRVMHGRHFTWRDGAASVTLVSPAVVGALVNLSQPYAARGLWLQVLIPTDLAQDMSSKLEKLRFLDSKDSESEDETDNAENEREDVSLPFTLAWPERGLKITVLSDEQML